MKKIRRIYDMGKRAKKRMITKLIINRQTIAIVDQSVFFSNANDLTINECFQKVVQNGDLKLQTRANVSWRVLPLSE